MFYLLVAFDLGNVNYPGSQSAARAVSRRLGHGVQGHTESLMLFGYATMALILVFVADASVMAWRRGERRKALMTGQSNSFSCRHRSSLAGPLGRLPVPVLISPFYLGLVLVMASALSHDVSCVATRPRALASEAGLRESEARVSLPSMPIGHLDPGPGAQRDLGEPQVA